MESYAQTRLWWTITNYRIGIKDDRAFEMKGCELKEIHAEEYRNKFVEISSSKMEEWTSKMNLSLQGDSSLQSLIKLRFSSESLKNKSINLETNLIYHYINHDRHSLKFKDYLTPTKEFIDDIENAIESKRPEIFIMITKKYGQFIPTEVVMGGRVYIEDKRASSEGFKEDSKGFGLTLGVSNIAQAEIMGNVNRKTGDSNRHKLNSIYFVGDESPKNFEYFDKSAHDAWVESLKDHKSWGCIEFLNPINIFRLLPDDLRRKIYLLFGKRILYSKTVSLNYDLVENGKPEIYPLIDAKDTEILETLGNKEVDYNIFATVIDTDES